MSQPDFFRGQFTKLGGMIAAAGVRSWMSTLECHAVRYDPSVDATHPDFRGPVIAMLWHEYMLAPLHLFGRTHSAILTSRHRDAEWLSTAARHLGFDTIRGSTYRGGTRAMLHYMRSARMRNLGVACDGPRGPRRSAAPGPIYLSSKLQIPLVAYGIGYDRPWRFPTWDRFALPRPHSRVRIVIGPRTQIPANLGRDALQRYQQQAEDLLLRLTFEAEAWAAAGSRKLGQYSLRRPAARQITPSDATRLPPLAASEARAA